MKFRFDPNARLLVFPATVFGPVGRVSAPLALDTGATYSMLNVAILAAAGYDSAQSPERVQITTGSGLEYAARLKVDVLNALGIDRRDFPMLAHTLPPSATVAGVLGLDFFRDLKLLIDFRSGQLTID